MTAKEFRKTKEYAESMDKIKSYTTGFKFSFDFEKIPVKKANALRVLLADATLNNLIECVCIGLNINGKIVEETYVRR